MKLVVGSDHAGWPLKRELLAHIASLGHEVIDIGSYDDKPVDFPDIARSLAARITAGQADRGLMVCGTGVGASIAANKMRGIRAAVCHDTYSARQGVEHDDLNVLCLGSRVIGIELAVELARAFLDARFRDESRFRRRLDMVLAIEAEETAG